MSNSSNIDFTCYETMDEDEDESSSNMNISYYLIKEYGGRDTIPYNNLLYQRYQTQYQTRHQTQKHQPQNKYHYYLQQIELLQQQLITRKQIQQKPIQQKPIPPHLHIKYSLLKLQCGPFHEEFYNRT